MNNPLISIIVPTYDEIENIDSCLDHLVNTMRNRRQNFEVVGVDSGSRDGTLEIWQSYAKNNPEVQLIQQERREGMGSALKEAYVKCRGDYICHYECDQSFPVEIYLEALTKLSNSADFILGVRLGNREGLLRNIYSAGYRFFIRTLFGINYRSINFSFKVFKRKILESFNLVSNRWFIDAELVIQTHRHDYIIEEYPVQHLARTKGRSKVRILDAIDIVSEGLQFYRNH